MSTGMVKWTNESGTVLKEYTYDKLTSGKWYYTQQLGNYSNLECQLLTEEICVGGSQGKVKSKKILSKKSDPEFVADLTHKDITFGSKIVKNGSCSRFR